MRAVLLKTQLYFMLSGVAFAASPPIGIVSASGNFKLESSVIWGNSTLFDGSTIETTQASSSLALKNGARIELGVASKAKIFENRMVLEKGAGVISGNYEVGAAGLKIRGARLRVAMADRVEVAAISGPASVSTGAGVLLAAIPAGRVMSFSMQARSTGAVTRTGCLVYKDGHFLLQDENTQEVSELSGGDAVMRDLRSNTGNRIEVNGNTTSARPVVNAASVSITVLRVTAKSQGGCLSVAAALNAQADAPPVAAPKPAVANTPPAPAPSGGGGGMSSGAKAAIIVAVVGGAGAGIGIALAMQHKGSTSP
jgi:hypothetical protein